jgi:glycogen debranching enzyme
MTNMQFQTENPQTEIFLASENHGFLMLSASGEINRKWHGLTIDELSIFAEMNWSVAHPKDAKFSHSANLRSWLGAQRTSECMSRWWQMSCGCRIEERWNWPLNSAQLSVTLSLNDHSQCKASSQHREVRVTPLWTLCPAGHASAGGGHAHVLHDPRSANKLIVGSTLSDQIIEFYSTCGTPNRAAQWVTVESPGQSEVPTNADAARGENQTRTILTTHSAISEISTNLDFLLQIEVVAPLSKQRNEHEKTDHTVVRTLFAGFNASPRNEQWQIAFTNTQYSLNQLIRRRSDGTLGLQAGLPWFTQFWTRDLCHSFRAAFLWSGRFRDGEELLNSLWKSSDRDIPNYTTATSTTNNSADALPLLLLTTADLIDTVGLGPALSEQLSKITSRLEIAANTFVSGNLMVHGPADTWMDAQKSTPDGTLVPCSPRANRAFEIQAFWLASLARWSEILRQSDKVELAHKLAAAGERGFKTVRELFFNKEKGLWADHLRPEGLQDLALRPNLLLGFHALQRAGVLHKLMTKGELSQAIDEMISADLIVPYGIRTLSPDTPVKHTLPINEIFGEESAYIHENKIHFHPYHEFGSRQGLEHPDWAYHNGTIWPWLSHCAIHLLSETEEHQHRAEQLTNTLVWHAVHGSQGGAMAELLDGLSSHSPRSWPKGAPHQAWSEAALIQTTFEDWLGLQLAEFGNTLRMNTSRWKYVGDFEVSFECKDGRVFVTNSADQCSLTLKAKSEKCKALKLEMFNPKSRSEKSATTLLEPGGSLILTLR